MTIQLSVPAASLRRGSVLHELAGLVDVVVGEVTQAIRNVSPSPRPSRSETDAEIKTFGALIHELAGAITRAATDVLKKHPATRVSREMGSEATMPAALKLAALSGAGARTALPNTLVLQLVRRETGKE